MRSITNIKLCYKCTVIENNIILVTDNLYYI